MTKKIDNNTINDSFNEEKQHLEKVINIAKNEYEKIKISKKNLKADIMEKRRYMWNELGAVATDVSSNYEMIAQNHEIAGSELFYDDMTTMSKILEKQMECPYFARIDFKENGYKYGEKIYIGKNGLRDKTNYDIIVCDWRSDIASMYYNYETGLASFVCQNGKIEGDLLLKRQFLIENGKLLNMFDTSVAIEDNFLMSILNSHSTDKMKTIVSTIQKSQNEIIREDTSDILIINGCAGSGKTSIALHRIAYLLYKSREKLSQKNFLIFSPNEIFNTYISGVLPDLGEQNVWQSTFVQFCNNALGGDLTPQSYLEFITNPINTEIYLKKNSKEFCEFLNEKVSNILKNMKFEGVKLYDTLIISGTQLKEIFDKNMTYLDYNKAYSRIYEMVIKETSGHKKNIMKKIENNLIEKNGAFFYTSDKDLALAVRYEYIAQVNSMKDIFKNHFYINCFDLYANALSEFFSDKEKDEFNLEREREYLKYEDIAPILLLMTKLGFVQKNHDILHIVVDEAQDYTYLQYVVLSMIFSDAKFTVLGDENQKLCENGSFNLFLNDITIDNSSTGSKKEKIIKQFNLTTNYRSSKEIVEFTNKIAGRKLCDYIERSSGKVKTEKANGLNDLYFKIDSALNDFKENGDFKNKTAIVVKNKDIAKHIFENINNENICLITEEKNIINKNCCIITLALAKGLEFDNVIVINNFENENTLYVACTRALHKLNLIEFK